MANPQLEDGYLRIASEYLEALARTYLPSYARQVLDVIIRKTWGYNKKYDTIATTQFVRATGLSKSAIYRARQILKQMKMVTICRTRDSQVLTYAIQKDYTKWQLYADTAIALMAHKLYAENDKNCMQRTILTINNTIDNKQADANYNIKHKSKNPTAEKMEEWKKEPRFKGSKAK